MPQIQDASLQIKRFVLPTTKDLPEDQQAWVDLNVGKFLLRDTLAVEHTETIPQANFDLLMMRIKDWNYTDSTGQKLPIDREHVEVAIDPLDFRFLVTQMEESEDARVLSETNPTSLDDESKKNSSSTSAPSEPQ
jgi:hypothetical protein